MAAIDPILEELSREAATTRRVLDRIPPDQLSWKPHPRSKSVGELAWHIAAIPRRMATMGQHDDVDLTTVKALPMPETAAEIGAGSASQPAEGKDLLAQLDDSALPRRATI